MHYKARLLSKRMSALHKRSRGRIIVLTGPRQTGKTTLASKLFPDHALLSMEDPVVRPEYSRLTAKDWAVRYPRAVIDEVQKLPPLMETIKACYDQYPEVRYILLGSSQIMVMKKIRETLAGRVAIQDLLPLTLPELMTEGWEEDPIESRLIRWLSDGPARDPGDLLQEVLGADERHAEAKQQWEYYLEWGGMPALVRPDFTPEDRRNWLADYFTTYLQRDLSDLGRLDDLEPFVRAQQAVALKTSKTINYSELGRLAGVTSPTAKKFLRYLEISYQVIALPAFYRNEEKRLSKQPKIVFLDPGVRRGVLRKGGVPDGLEWESAVISEIFKQIKSKDLAVSFYHVRTFDGSEVDLLLECEEGFVAVECKMTRQAASSDFRGLRALPSILDRPLLAGLLVCQEDGVRSWEGPYPMYSTPPSWLLT
jgi:predicted AAA+ superfamily ATPase